MRYLLKVLCISFIIFHIYFSIKVEAKDVIKILMKKPNSFEAQNLETYNYLINEYFTNKNSTDNVNIEIEFSYCDETNVIKKVMNILNKEYYNDSEYVNYLTCIIKHLKNPIYDMMILDERYLFSDISLIENFIIEDNFNFRKLHQNFVDFSLYINNNDLSHHDKMILKDGNFMEKIYGLPYEFDFDLLYYKGESNKFNNYIIEDNKIWNDMITTSTNKNETKYPIRIAFDDNDELLNLFIEYTSTLYNIQKFRNPYNSTTNIITKDNYNSYYFNIFYNEQSSTLFNSFRNFVDKCSELNMETKLKMDMEKTYKYFYEENNSIFKGKASQYFFFQSNNNQGIDISILPKGYCAINEKYLVINRNSNKPLDKLVKIALQLTSKEMQFYKAKKLGSIPTFNFTKDDEIIKNYCKENSKLCSIIEKVKQLPIKDFFKINDYSASFMEIRLLLPNIIKNFLENGKLEPIISAFKNIEVIKMTTPYKIDKSILGLYIFMNILVLISFFVIIMIYKYRKHPYLKIISPRFSNLIIFGFILNIFTPFFLIQNYSILRCKISYIYGNICKSLILLPMFTISLRIFYIYTNKSKVNFDINSYRFSICWDNHYLIHNSFELIYETILIAGTFIMIKKTGKISKKFGEVKFIYSILYIFIAETVTVFITYYVPYQNNYIFIFLSCFYGISCIICIYLLVGSRLLYIVKHPDNQESSTNEGPISNYPTTIDIVDFIPSHLENEKHSYLFNNKNKMKSSSSDSQIEDDPITNNPNNIFFNRSLEMLNQPDLS
eukprot:jgi/Orpsp1_1/1180398/evm.model.c7180000073244.1